MACNIPHNYFHIKIHIRQNKKYVFPVPRLSTQSVFYSLQLTQLAVSKYRLSSQKNIINRY